jgi:hypothetical protein
VVRHDGGQRPEPRDADHRAPLVDEEERTIAGDAVLRDVDRVAVLQPQPLDRRVGDPGDRAH